MTMTSSIPRGLCLAGAVLFTGPADEDLPAAARA